MIVANTQVVTPWCYGPRGGDLYSKVDMMLVQETSKKGNFFPTVNVRVYIEKGVKNSKIWNKGYVFSILEIVIRV